MQSQFRFFHSHEMVKEEIRNSSPLMLGSSCSLLHVPVTLESDYQTFVEEEIRRCVRFQEATGLDVLVHGEFERNDARLGRGETGRGAHGRGGTPVA